MKRKFTLAVGLIAATALSACGGVDSVTMSDGSQLEVASAGKGATEVAAWKFTDAKTGQQAVGVRETDSMAARVVPGVATAATAGLINMATAIKVQDMQNDQCGSTGCGGGGAVAQVVLSPGAVTSNSAADSGSTSSSSATASGSCPGGVCLGTMD